MDLCSGGDLDLASEQDGSIPENHVLDFCLRVGNALQSAHSRGLIVGDVRCNKFLLDNNSLKLGSLSRAFAFEQVSNEQDEVRRHRFVVMAAAMLASSFKSS